jgi:peptide/nickel transport system substrate-binding protein
MYTKRNKIMCQILWLETLFCFIGFLYAIPCSAQKAPKGKVVVASRETFSMNGGDCHTSQGSGTINLCALIHEGLVRKALDGSMVPALAKSWKFGKGGLSVTFTLDERAKFHNGEPVTAADVKFSLERSMRPELKFFRAPVLKQNIDRIEVLDDHRLTVYLKAACPALFEYSWQYLGIIPKAYTEKVGDSEFAKHPIGTGPFKWVDYQQDVFVRAQAFEDHYRQVPKVKTVEFKFAVDDATLMAMLRAGEVDVAQLPLSTYAQLKDDRNIKILWAKFVSAPALGFADLAFPNEPSPFHDIRVRRAVSYAINRKAICERILHGAAEPWGDIFAPYHVGVNQNIKPFPYDPEKAKALLKEAGYPNGFETTVTCGHPAGDKIELQAITSDLARVGIRSKFIELEGGIYLRHIAEKKIHGIFRLGSPWWVGISHPGVAMESVFSEKSIWSYYTTPELNAEWLKLSEMTDEKDIEVQAKKVSRLWHESEIKYMLWANHQPFGVSARVKAYTPVPGVMQITGLEYLDLKE